MLSPVFQSELDRSAQHETLSLNRLVRESEVNSADCPLVLIYLHVYSVGSFLLATSRATTCLTVVRAVLELPNQT